MLLLLGRNQRSQWGPTASGGGASTTADRWERESKLGVGDFRGQGTGTQGRAGVDINKKP